MHMRSIRQCADVYSEYGQEHQPSRIWIFVIPLNLLTYVRILIKLHHRHSFNIFLSTHNCSTIFSLDNLRNLWKQEVQFHLHILY